MRDPGNEVEIRLQRIMVVVFIKTNIQSKMMNTTTMIPFSQRRLAIVFLEVMCLHDYNWK